MINGHVTFGMDVGQYNMFRSQAYYKDIGEKASAIFWYCFYRFDQMCAELTLLGRVGSLVDDDAESQRRREGVELVGQQ